MKGERIVPAAYIAMAALSAFQVYQSTRTPKTSGTLGAGSDPYPTTGTPTEQAAWRARHPAGGNYLPSATSPGTPTPPPSANTPATVNAAALAARRARMRAAGGSSGRVNLGTPSILQQAIRGTAQPAGLLGG